MKNLIYLFLSFFCFNIQNFYTFSKEPIDAVIPCHEKDSANIDFVIEGIRNNVKNINRIIVISSKPFTNNAEWFDEKQFPFTKKSLIYEIYKDDIKTDNFLKNPQTRSGWIYQQLIKLYSCLIIPNISSNVLIVDADTIFLRSIEFQDAAGAGLFNPGIEYHVPYFEHASRLLPGFKRVFPEHSGISHHMLFQRCVIEDLFNTIRSIHNLEPWKALCRCIDINQIYGSSLSEYEIYFNFVFQRSDQFKIRKLKWLNTVDSYSNRFKKYDYDYVSCHIWIS